MPSVSRHLFHGWRDRLPGLVGFVDPAWSSLFSSSVGYSLVLVDNTSGQLPNAFKRGQYALGNLLLYLTGTSRYRGRAPVGPAPQHPDNWTYDDYRIQFSMRYKFGKTLAL